MSFAGDTRRDVRKYQIVPTVKCDEALSGGKLNAYFPFFGRNFFFYCCCHNFFAVVWNTKLLIEKKGDVEKLAKELLKKEVLFKSDVEALIGKRPYEEKKTLDIKEEDVVADTPQTAFPEELKNPTQI